MPNSMSDGPDRMVWCECNGIGYEVCGLNEGYNGTGGVKYADAAPDIAFCLNCCRHCSIRIECNVTYKIPVRGYPEAQRTAVRAVHVDSVLIEDGEVPV